jgi:hypothetical protein
MTRLVLFMLVFCSCQRTIKTPNEFFAWMNNPTNGLYQKKVVDGLELSMKYLPPEYLALKELKGKYNEEEAKKLKKEYEKSCTFLLTLKPLEEEDMMKRGILDETEYQKRFMNVHFGLERMVKLKTSNAEYAPILSAFEDTYGTTKHRSAYIVFGGENWEKIKKEKEWDIIFDDEILDTGIHHFQYNVQTLQNTPILKFWTTK